MVDYTVLNDIFDDVSAVSEEELEDIRDFLEKDNRRARRRRLNISKARHKRYISRKVHGLDWYKNLHQYSKNKVHCSCNLCRFRPNWDPNNMSMRDVRRTEIMNQRLREYNENL